LGRPLGDLGATTWDRLRGLLGEQRFNSLWSSQCDAQFMFAGQSDAKQLCDALRAAGYDATVLDEPRYAILRETSAGSSVLIIEDETEHRDIVGRMLAAGVPVRRGH
jgi:hypothetical protein